jgi:hypothetical protein
VACWFGFGSVVCWLVWFWCWLLMMMILLFWDVGCLWCSEILKS